MARSNIGKISKELNYLRFKPWKDGRVLATTDTGDFAILQKADFDALVKGELSKESDLYKELDKKNFFINDEMLKRAFYKYQNRYSFAQKGPNLHILVVTLRCNYNCVYCHASKRGMEKAEYDMTIDTAKKAVDFIFTTPNSAINIEFQGGEPLANWPVVDFVIDYAREKNKQEKKELAFSVVTNLSLMDGAKLDKLIAEDIYLCTSIDGPEKLHNKNRPYTGGSSYELTTSWMKVIEDRYKALGMDPKTHHVDVLLTVSKESLKLGGKKIVDEYVKLGRNTIHLRPLNPFGFGKKAWSSIGYSIEEFNAFYNDTLDYILQLNAAGTEILERQAAIVLTRILSDEDPNYMELRSPCGAGIGQLAYNYDGKIFTCDEARMVFEMGDEIFLLGEAGISDYKSVIEHDTTKVMAMASCQDGIPGCDQCVYKPYCGVCPVFNYAEQGDIFGRMPTNERCKLLMNLHEKLFDLIDKNDDGINAVFKRWITRRRREGSAAGPA